MIFQFDTDTTYKTRSGRQARFYALQPLSQAPMHGAILNPGKGWEMCCWDKEGYRISPAAPHPDDLLGVWTEGKKKMLAWVNTNGILGLFEEGQAPQDVTVSGQRVPWLDEPE